MKEFFDVIESINKYLPHTNLECACNDPTRIKILHELGFSSITRCNDTLDANLIISPTAHATFIVFDFNDGVQLMCTGIVSGGAKYSLFRMFVGGVPADTWNKFTVLSLIQEVLIKMWLIKRSESLFCLNTTTPVKFITQTAI